MALASVAALLMCGAAHAQSFRAYLSSSGNDGNPCTVAAPCRLLPAALTAVASGGEIWILDSANYNAGTVGITKSVTILAVPGVVGSFVAFGGGAALVMSGGVDVKLRNMAVVNNVTNSGTDGIQITGGSLDVAESQFAVPGNAITATNATVRVHHAVFRDLTNGIVAHGSSTVDVWNSRFTNIYSTGIYARADSASAAGTLSVSECSFAGVFYGVIASAENFTATMKAAIAKSTFANGNYAITIENITGSGARGTVSSSAFSNHAGAFYNYNAALFESAGDNALGSTNGTNLGTITNVGRM